MFERVFDQQPEGGRRLTRDDLLSAFEKLRDTPLTPHIHAVHPSDRPGQWAMCANCMQYVKLPDA